MKNTPFETIRLGEFPRYTDRPRLFARLWALPGVRRWQVGDQEARALVPVERLPDAAALIQASRRRQLTSEAGPKTVRAPHSQGDSKRLGARLAPEAASLVRSGRLTAEPNRRAP